MLTCASLVANEDALLVCACLDVLPVEALFPVDKENGCGTVWFDCEPPSTVQRTEAGKPCTSTGDFSCVDFFCLQLVSKAPFTPPFIVLPTL